MELDTNEENLGMIVTTKKPITVFKPVLLAGVMSVALLPTAGHANQGIAAARDAFCGTTNFFTSNCSQCHSGTPSGSTAFTSTPACPAPVAAAPEPVPVTPPPEPVVTAPVAPPPEPVATAPVAPPPEPVATAPVAPPPDPAATAPVAPPPDLVAITDPVPHGCTDEDQDGFAADGGSCGPRDCRDSDPHINPGAGEICDDGIDNNCNGLVDLVDNKACDVPLSCADGDGDGFYAGGSECGPTDCDDGNWQVNPGENEVCTDGIDNNCNARIDGIDIACQVRDHEGDHEEDSDHDGDHEEDTERDHHGDHDHEGDHE